MTRRPLIVGALVVLVGVALVLLGMQRGADTVAAAPTLAPTSALATPAPRSPGPSRTSTSTPTLTLPAAPTSLAAPSGPAGLPTTVEHSVPRLTAEAPRAATPPATSGIELRIPGIGLRESLHAEGLRGGKINPPSGSVMWFTGYDRVRPGQVGTAVIAGHVASRGAKDAFAELSRVRVGEQVTLAGAAAGTYRVVEAGVVDKTALTTDQRVWGANSSVRRLAIITCDDAHGFRSDGHRVANYVVIAEQV